MRTIVEIFKKGQLETMGRIQRERAVEDAIAHHARQLSELAHLLAALFEQGKDRKGKRRFHSCIDSDFFLPPLRVLLKERYEIINYLEDEYNRIHDLDEGTAPTTPPKPKGKGRKRPLPMFHHLVAVKADGAHSNGDGQPAA